MGRGPGPARAREGQPASAQEVAQALAGPVEVLAEVLACAHEIAHLLLDHGRHPHEGELARGEQTRQALGVAGVGLHPVGGLSRDQPRRAHAHVEAALGRRPGEGEASGPGLVDGVHAGSEPLEEGEHHTDGVALQAPADELSGAVVEDPGVRLWCMDIETRERHSLHGAGTSHRWGVGRRPIPPAQSPIAMRRGAGPSGAKSGQRPLHRV